MSMALAPLNGCSMAKNASVAELLNDKPQLDGLVVQMDLIFKRYSRLMALEEHRNRLESSVEELMSQWVVWEGGRWGAAIEFAH